MKRERKAINLYTFYDTYPLQTYNAQMKLLNLEPLLFSMLGNIERLREDFLKL